MEILRLLYIATGPGIAIAVYIYFSDKWEPEPRLLVIKSFMLGALAFFPTGYLENTIQSALGLAGSGWDLWWQNILFAFFGVALVEEGCKFLFIKGFIYDDRQFNEPFDGIVYGGMVGCGFATMENLAYVFAQGYPAGVARMFTAIPGHAFDGVILGYFVGKAKFSARPVHHLSIGLTVVILLHGIYDSAVYSQAWWSSAVLFGIVFLGIYAGLKAKRQLEKHSEFLEFSPRQYSILQNGVKHGPFGVKALRDSLAEDRVQLDDVLVSGRHDKKTTVREVLSADKELKAYRHPREPASHQPVWKFVLFYGLTFGLYLYFWFMKNYRDFRNIKRVPLNPELRGLALFVFSIVPFYIYGTVLNVYQEKSFHPVVEYSFLAAISAGETLFLFFQFKMIRRFLKRALKGSFHPLTVCLFFFGLGCVRKIVPIHFSLNAIWELGFVLLQGGALTVVQADLNRYWSHEVQRLKASQEP